MRLDILNEAQALHRVRRNASLYTLMTVWALSWSFPLAAIAADPEATPLEYFGLHIHNATSTTPWPLIKFGSIRLWDIRANWRDIEPVKGRWNFSTLDQYIRLASEHGVEIVFPLGATPQWASARPGEAGAYGPGSAAEVRDMEDWRNYVRTVTDRYKGLVSHWEMWNEVNGKQFYTGTKAALVDMQREAFDIVKSADPGNVFISASVTEGYWAKWFDEYLAAGGARYADVIAYHFYVPKTLPEVMDQDIQKIRDVMRKYGVADKPLWNTESGWWIRDPYNPKTKDVPKGSGWRAVDLVDAPAFVSRALIIVRANGVQRFHWYDYDGEGMGLIDTVTRQPRHSALAFDRTAGWLVGRQVWPCTKPQPGIWLCSISEVSKPYGYVAWSTGETANQLPASAINGVKVIERLDGSTTPIPSSSSSIPLGPEPVLLR